MIPILAALKWKSEKSRLFLIISLDSCKSILLENFGSWHFIFGSIRENRPQRIGILIFLKTPHNIGEGSPRYNFCTKTGYSLSYQLSLPATFHTNKRELPARANPRPPSSEPVISPNAIEYVLNFHLIREQWSTNWPCTQSQYRPRDLINTLSQWEQVIGIWVTWLLVMW